MLDLVALMENTSNKIKLKLILFLCHWNKKEATKTETSYK